MIPVHCSILQCPHCPLYSGPYIACLASPWFTGPRRPQSQAMLIRTLACIIGCAGGILAAIHETEDEDLLTLLEDEKNEEIPREKVTNLCKLS